MIETYSDQFRRASFCLGEIICARTPRAGSDAARWFAVEQRLEDRVAYIGALRVSRAHRRQGIAVQLITCAYHRAKGLQLGSIKMKVSPDNERMKRLIGKHLINWPGLLAFNSKTGNPLDPNVKAKKKNNKGADQTQAKATKKK